MASRHSHRHRRISLVGLTLVVAVCAWCLGLSSPSLAASHLPSTPIDRLSVPATLSHPAITPPGQSPLGQDMASQPALTDRPSELSLGDDPAANEDDPGVWKWVAIAFVTVFVAEMGDKTQLATVLMSAQGKSPWTIFLGSASALVAASVVSVTLGDWMSRVLPPNLLQLVAGISFVVIGIYVLWEAQSEAEDTISDSPSQD